jgi:hypothetical protein
LDISVSDFFDIVKWEENLTIPRMPSGETLMKGEINNELIEERNLDEYFGILN